MELLKYFIVSKNTDGVKICGKKQGTFRYRLEDGRLHVKTFKNNKLHGIHRVFWYRDIMVHEAQYVNGKRHGLCRDWEDGQLHKEKNYVNGKIHGLAYLWYNYYNKQLYAQKNYVNGKIHGLACSWHANGRIYMQTNYVNGEKHGLERTWYENGRLEKERIFKNGNDICTSHREWDKNGKLTYKDPAWNIYYRALGDYGIPYEI